MGFDKERTAGNLRTIRTMRGLSRKDLAEQSSVSIDSIKGYENAETVMSLETAAKIAAALECSVDSLVNKITFVEDAEAAR